MRGEESCCDECIFCYKDATLYDSNGVVIGKFKKYCRRGQYDCSRIKKCDSKTIYGGYCKNQWYSYCRLTNHKPCKRIKQDFECDNFEPIAQYLR